MNRKTVIGFVMGVAWLAVILWIAYDIGSMLLQMM